MTARLAVTDLTLVTRRGGRVVDEATISIAPGEIVGLVGESGAGKTTLARATLGQLRSGLEVQGGSVAVDGEPSLLELGDEELRALRGARISFVAQHPLTALNPARGIRAQMLDVLRAHRDAVPVADDDEQELVADALAAVALPSAFTDRYPHELSGGQRQRAALAIALVGRPEVLVLDEPTTGLDALTGRHVLAAIRRRAAERGLAVLCVTHDLDVVANIADRLAVMYAGTIVEDGPTAAVMARPAHPYTRHLLAARPDPTATRPVVGLPGQAPRPDDERPGECPFAARCALVLDACRAGRPAAVPVAPGHSARCLRPFGDPIAHRAGAGAGAGAGARVGAGTDAAEAADPGAGRVSPAADTVLLHVETMTASFGPQDVVHDVTFDVRRGEWLALVGRSGAGKTTLVRAIAGLHPARAGGVVLGGEPLAGRARRRTASQRRAVHLVLQHPHASFNPRRTIGDSVSRPRRLAGANRRDARRDVAVMLERVGLDGDVVERYPDEVSGGELQRAAIARALVGGPQLLLCDEITSSLDTVVQASLVELLLRLQGELGLAIIFVTHDLALAAASSDRTAVLVDGRLAEIGPTADVFAEPQHAGTRDLLVAASRARP